MVGLSAELGGRGARPGLGRDHLCWVCETVHAAVAAGIDLIDLAPRYGNGKAEEVVGAAINGRPPHGVRVTSKCNLGELPPQEIEPTLRRSIKGSLRRLRLARLDLFFFALKCCTRFGPPFAPARCGIANDAESSRLATHWTAPGGGVSAKSRMIMFGWPMPVSPQSMGIRAVQAGALTTALDRVLPEDHPEMRDYARAAGFRRWAAECVVAAEQGPLSAELMAGVDRAVAAPGSGTIS